MNSSTTILPPQLAISPYPNAVVDVDQQQQSKKLFLSMSIVISIKFLLAICTILTSSSLILVTIKSRNLHGPCNLLLAANSFCISLYSLSFFIQFAAILLAGPNGISVRLCCLIQSIPIIGNYGQYVFFALIALDRLTSVLLPLWSRSLHLSIQRQQNVYIFVLFCIGFGYGFVASISSIFQAFGNSDRLVICETGTSTPQILSNIGMVLAIASAFFYLSLLISFKLRQWKFSSAMSSPVRRDNEYTRRLLRSLMAMFLMEFFGWSSNQIATKILNAIGYDSMQRWFIKCYVGYLTQTTLLLYAPILYIFSYEYRLAFSKIFCPKKSNGIIVVPSTAIVLNNPQNNYSSAFFRNYQQQKMKNNQNNEINNNQKDTPF